MSASGAAEAATCISRTRTRNATTSPLHCSRRNLPKKGPKIGADFQGGRASLLCARGANDGALEMTTIAAPTDAQALRAEQERMKSLLDGLQATLHTKTATRTPATYPPPTPSAAANPPPTPAAAARSSAGLSSFSPSMPTPLRTIDRATTPSSARTQSVSLIEMSGELQEARGALEAVHAWSPQSMLS